MSGEMHQVSDLDRDILHLLARGWHTTDHVKSGGILSAEEIAGQTTAGVDEVTERLVFLETMGYVINEANFGGDPTLAHMGIDRGAAELKRLEPRYHVSEHGMRMALAEATTDVLSTERQE